ncbi:MAG: hypothetical protein KJ727_03280 [Acidobacteria bacterium]|nr:hypothetical protein [Acidobacteriota bacterium]MBU4253608.1 hypothetical protein [Acidobacteriota bacterium]MBU4329815.1 hypothetical protein [Acidobacteriota bacterium]MCG2814427.1 hypothetical protein [Candidatus Aminicenantes bacterium]
MANVYYVGDWAIMTGPVFHENPFYVSHKGVDIYNYGKWLKAALAYMSDPAPHWGNNFIQLKEDLNEKRRIFPYVGDGGRSPVFIRRGGKSV